MVCGTFVIKGVPKDKLDETTSLFTANEPAPESVTSKKGDDGSYTVTAVFPKCPGETTHSPEGH